MKGVAFQMKQRKQKSINVCVRLFCSLAVLLVGGSLSTVFAGSKLVSGSIGSVPGWGHYRVDHKHGDKKITVSKMATFKGTSCSALLHGSLAITTSKSVAVSNWAKFGLSVSHATTTAKKGTTYYGAYKTHPWEPNNGQWAKYKFSSDTLF